MKTINLYLFLLTIILAGCNGFLDEASQDQIRPNKAEHLASLVLNECTLTHPYFYGASHMTDDISENMRTPTSRKRNYKTVYTWKKEIELDDYGAQIGTNVAWGNLYRSIAILNDVLISCEDINDNERELAFVRGEAYFLRALAYFDLVNLYALPYEPEKVKGQLGVAIRLDHGVERFYTRNSLEDCYNLIERDLALGKSELEKSGLEKSLWHPSVNACNLLMSRVKLFRHEWQAAADYADSVTTKVGMTKMLDSMKFVEPSNSEIIYSFMYDRKALSIENMENTGFVVSENLLSCYEQDNDIRFRCFFVMRGDSRQRYYYPRKFESDFTSLGGFNMRVAEAWLNKAEACVRLGDINGARLAVKRVVDYRYRRPGDVTIPFNQDELLQFIFDERRREFCFESYFRWNDLRRMGEEYRPEIKHVFTYVNDNEIREGQESYRLLKNDPNYVLSIPLAERENNPLIINNDRMEKLPE